jgi:hypothetical protein
MKEHFEPRDQPLPKGTEAHQDQKHLCKHKSTFHYFKTPVRPAFQIKTENMMTSHQHFFLSLTLQSSGHGLQK